MIDFLLTTFRYIFLIIMYIFIFQLIKMIFRDLRAVEPAAAHREKLNQAGDRAFRPGAVAELAVVHSPDPGLPVGNVFSLKAKAEISLGRGSRNTITLVDPFASMDHALIYGKDGQFWLEDRESRNGTFLNDIKISKPTVLADGDRIRIGDVTMQFVRWSYEVEPGNRSGTHKEAERG